MKVCSKCNILKTPEEFYKIKSKKKNKTYPSAYCKSCNRVLYRQNLEYFKLTGRKDHLKRSYNLSLADFEDLKSIQEGKCAICKQEQNLHVDHDHVTKKTRGLLCRSCNTGIGLLGEDTKDLTKQLNIWRKEDDGL